MKLYLAVMISILPVVYGCGGSARSSDSPTIEPSPDYAVVYNRTTVDEYEIEMSTADWKTLQNNPFEYVTGTVRFKDEVYRNVGVRYKGKDSLSYSAASSPKKPFKLQFNEFVPGQLFHGLKTLNFNNGYKDPSLMREMIGYDIFEAAGSPASRTSHIKLYVTVPGVYDHEFFGVYISVEQVDESYLADRFPENGGNLYKAGFWASEGSQGRVTGPSLEFLGSEKSLYGSSAQASGGTLADSRGTRAGARGARAGARGASAASSGTIVMVAREDGARGSLQFGDTNGEK